MKLAAASDLPVGHDDWDDETRTLIVRASDQDRRDWVLNSPLVQQLASRNIANVGITWAKRAFEMLREDPGGTFFIACFDGNGIVFSSGMSDTIGQHQACLLPRHLPNRIQSGGNQWTYAFVRYLEPPTVIPIARIDAPKICAYDAAPLVQAIRGLYAEASGACLTSALRYWVELIHGYVLQCAQSQYHDDRIRCAWDRVTNQLSHPWTLNEIAAEGSLSTEHFRRLCREAVGASPMKHLTHLRMQRAAELLETTDLKIEAITHEVGYGFASTFSNTFQKWSGLRPSEFRLVKK